MDYSARMVPVEWVQEQAFRRGLLRAAKAGDQAAIQTLWRVYRLRLVPVPRHP